MTTPQHWHQQVGSQRDWIWRGWQTRYTYLRAAQATPGSTPIILLHGFGASIGHWRKNLTELGQGHTVYALDLIGFGASEKAIAPYSISFWVEQVYDFWRTLIRQPVVLVGNSIGSMVCLTAAARYPEMVKGIVMMSLPDPSLESELVPPAFRPAIATTKRLVSSLLYPLFYVIRRPSFIRAWARLAYTDPTQITDELVEILAGPAQDRGAAQAFCAIFRCMSIGEAGLEAKTLLPTLQIPILLIWGQQDQMVPYKLANPQQFTRYNPNLKLIELDQCGHCPHDECPERVNQEILTWIDSWAAEPKQTKNSPLLPVES